MIDTNAHRVMANYINRMSGAVAIARTLDVYKMSEWENLLKHAMRQQLGTPLMSEAKKAKLEKHLRFAMDRILGIPQEEFTCLNKGLEMLRKYNVIRLMGGAVFNQLVEYSNVAGTVGMKATLEAVGELHGIIRDARTGKLSHELLSGIEDLMGGAGLEFSRQLDFAHDDWVRKLGNTKTARALDKLDSALDRGASGVLYYTGMTPLTLQQQRVFSLAYMNRLIDIAHAAGDRSYFSKDRLHWMGLSENDFEQILASLKTYTKERKGINDAQYNIIDFERFVKERPEEYNKLALAVRRESRRVVQENDLASMIPIMGTTFGKTMFQFMNFAMQAWSKSMLFSLNHRDFSTYMTVLYGGTLSCLVYIARTYTQAAGMEAQERKEFLEKRLAVQQIVANTFGRLQQATVLPNLIDTVSPVPFFSGMRTTSDASGLVSNPSWQLINSVISAKKLIRNGLSDEEQTTQRDARALFRILPLTHTIPAMVMGNWLMKDLPTSEKEN